MRRPRGTAIEKAPGVWLLRASTPADVNGKRGKRSRIYHGSPRPRSGGLPKDVEKELAAWVAEVEASKLVGPAHSYQELVDEWLKIANIEEQTRYGYEGYLRRYLLPVFGHRRVSEITVQELDRFYAEMRRDGFSPRTIRQAHAILRRSLAVGVKWGWVPYNPAAMTAPDIKGLARAEVDAPTPDEVRLLLKELERTDPLVGLYVKVSAALGTRRGEALGLRFLDVNFEESTITVERSVYRVPGQALKTKGTKTGASGTLAVPTALTGELSATLASALARANDVGVTLRDPYIFTDDPAGRVPWLPDTVSDKVRDTRDRLGLPKRVTLKNLRHFHATQLLAAGVDIGTVASRLRHTQKATTLNFYSKKDEAADRRAGDLWGDIL